MLRLAHLSDVHVFAANARFRAADWFNKRLTGWLNLRYLPRGKLFRDSAAILRVLMADVYAQRPDFIIFSGDASSLGTDEEFALAAEIMGVGRPGAIPGLAVPGNHDYYIRRAAASGDFERQFAPWLEGERVDGATYPFLRRVGPVDLYGVNSSTGNRLWWDATGRVGDAQLARLTKLLAEPRRGPRILVTHFPVALKDGRPENRVHRLRDLDATLAVARAGGIDLWLHGHRHHPYVNEANPSVPFPCICAGSGTQLNCWTYPIYTIDGTRLHLERRTYHPSRKAYERVAEQEIEWKYHGAGL